jgi:reactive chlorine resistance protein C
MRHVELVTSDPHADRLAALGGWVLRYGLVAIILWFGAFKFTAAEAEAIEPLIANSPPLSRLYGLTDVRGVSRLIGAAELVIGVLIALRPAAPTRSALGSLGAVGMFLMTLSFLATTPGMWTRVEGFVAPTDAGGFIVKDLVLLGAALWTAGEALRARRLPPVEGVAASAVRRAGVVPS